MKILTLRGRRVRIKTSVSVWLSGVYLVLALLLAVLLPVLPLPFKPEELDLQHILAPPAFLGEHILSRHWLGTDHVGRDVLVNLLYGFRTGFLIALPVMFIATMLGVLLGSLAGFYGNRKLRVSRSGLFCFFLFLLATAYFVIYLFPFFTNHNQDAATENYGRLLLIGAGVIIFLFLLQKILKTVGFLHKKVAVPIDELVLKTMELLSSVPRLVLILAFSAVASPGIGNVMVLLSLTYWAGPARLMRAEVLKIKQLPYIEAAEVSGLPARQIIFRHILPNAMPPLWVAFSFGLSSLLGLEAALSFLGIGLPPEIPSWGKMLAGARLNPEAWWLVFFPALTLCFTILAIQTLGNYLQRMSAK